MGVASAVVPDAPICEGMPISEVMKPEDPFNNEPDIPATEDLSERLFREIDNEHHLDTFTIPIKPETLRTDEAISANTFESPVLSHQKPTFSSNAMEASDSAIPGTASPMVFFPVPAEDVSLSCRATFHFR